MRQRSITIVVTFVLSLFVATAAAQAVVLDLPNVGRVGVAFSPDKQIHPWSGLPVVTSGGACQDPALASDLGGPFLPADAICSHGGRVMHANETFALTWDPLRRYWQTTRNFVEQFLSDVATGSGTLTSPYAVTGQYSDQGGRAKNSSLYGGGCIDYGSTGGSACKFGSTNGNGAGHSYPSNGCAPTGSNQFHEDLSGQFDTGANDTCITDGQIRSELATMISETGLRGRTVHGFTPLVVLFMPPGVVTCLSAASKFCSANSRTAPPPPSLNASGTGGTITPGDYQVEVTYVTGSGETVASAPQKITTTSSTSTLTINSPPPGFGATGWYAYVTQAGGSSFTRQPDSGPPNPIGTNLTLTAPPTTIGAAPPLDSVPSFCSYHSQVNVNGVEVSYVVQPWTAYTTCDDPDIQPLQPFPTAQQLANDVGKRLVSPLSQGQIAAIVNPGLNSWFARDGSEVGDNGCIPLGDQSHPLDSATVGRNQYFLQREFNNGGAIENDPNAPICTPSVTLDPQFVIPSSVNRGDVVEFDGSDTASSLLVPKNGFVWNFGDGTNAIGPSVEHAYSKAGTYHVTLVVIDRGGDVRSLSEVLNVLGPTAKTTPGLHVRLQLLPQSLHRALRYGINTLVSSNAAADGMFTVSVSRKAARRAHINTGRGATVVIGRGTVSGIAKGTVDLHLHLSRAVVRKLGHLSHIALTVRLSLVTANGGRASIVAAGRY